MTPDLPIKIANLEQRREPADNEWERAWKKGYNHALADVLALLMEKK